MEPLFQIRFLKEGRQNCVMNAHIFVSSPLCVFCVSHSADVSNYTGFAKPFGAEICVTAVEV